MENGLALRTGDLNSASWGAWAKVWHSANGGHNSGLDADLLDGAHAAIAATPSSVVERDASGDINVRLLRSSYATQTTTPASSAAIAFRNSTSDNYHRTMSNTAFSSWCQAAHIKAYDSVLLGGVGSSSYLLKSGGTMTGLLIGRASSGSIAVASQGTPGVEIQSVGGASNASYMTFHRPGAYAVRFGLDTNNKMCVGGWSMGAVSRKLVIEDSGTYGINITGNSGSVNSLVVGPTANTTANRTVRTDSSGYINAGWINTNSGANTTQAIARVYASHDSFIRYYSLADFAAQVLTQGSAKNAHTHPVTSASASVSSTWAGKPAGTAGAMYVALPAGVPGNASLYRVAVTITINTYGNAGDVFAWKGTSNIYVYRTGSYTGTFDVTFTW